MQIIARMPKFVITQLCDYAQLCFLFLYRSCFIFLNRGNDRFESHLLVVPYFSPYFRCTLHVAQHIILSPVHFASAQLGE